MKKYYSGKFVVLLTVISLLIGSAVTFGGFLIFNKDVKESQHQQSHSSNLSTDSGFNKVEDVFNLISDSYFRNVDKNKLYNGAIQGMIKSLNDPFSDYMDPKTAQQFNQSLSASFQGIGAEVQMVDGKVTIVSPYKGSPADKAGLKPHDQIVTVNGESIKGLNLYDAVLKIRGKKGTVVKLGILHPGSTTAVQVDVTRDTIPIKTVYSKTMKKDGKTFGIIQISSFAKGTAEEFTKKLKDLEDKGIDGLVIDVRGNPGGLLDSVKKIADLFITDNKPIVQIEDRNGNIKRLFSTLKQPKPYPIVDLIDSGSASAAEILSGALNEAGGYPLIGVKSFGKGTVQQTYPMKDGSNLKITTFKWLTPDGHWIHKKGIKPTIEVKEPDYFYTSQLTLKKNETLKYDTTSSQISDAQRMLKGLGFAPGRVDGYFGKQTETAVKAFQRANQLPINGEIDEKTAGKLMSDILTAVNNPKNDRQLQVAIETLLKKLQ